MGTRWIQAIAGLLTILLTACVGPARDSVSSFHAVGTGETVVVGRVELVPPLGKEEQVLTGWGTGNVKDKVFLVTDERYRELKQEPGPSDFTGRIEATPDKTFFVRSSNKPFYILIGMMWLELGAGQSKVYFPGGLKVSIQSGDKAVYIGTIRYHRDEFFNITKTRIVDDYGRANAEFKKQFGTKVALRKSLATAVSR